MSDRSERTNRIGYIVSAGDLIVALLAVVSIAVGSIDALALWVIGAIVYLIGGAIIIGAGAMGDLAESRAGAAEVTSWIFPLVASLAGINAALVALLGQSQTGISWDSVLGAVGIILSWMLLQIGFANIYVSRYGHGGEHRCLDFPGQPDEPGFAEFIYFSFSIGTSFAVSDVSVRCRPMRNIVTIHSIVSFLYNALVVAIAFQVLQQIARAA